MRRRLVPLLGLAAALALAPHPRPSEGQDPASALDAFRAKVRAAMADVKATRGTFTQTKKLAVFDDAVVSSGSFAIQRPDRLRWEIERPFHSILTIAGDKGARWNETRRAVERFSLADKPGIDVAVKQLFAWYQGKLDDVSSQFVPSVGDDGRSVSLVPKNDQVKDVVQRITLRFAADLRTIEAIALEEKEGDRTDIVFRDVAVNPELDGRLFDIEDR